MKICFGIISGFPDVVEHKTQRMQRLDNTFKQLCDLFGNDIEFLIIAQNGGDYEIPSFVKHAKIYYYNKLGILGARNTLRDRFLESPYDYLIMCDDDIILEAEDKKAPKNFIAELEKHPDGFTFLQYGGSLTFCAVSKYIYSRDPLPNIDPEKNEGYEDVVGPLLLHYKYPTKEFKTAGLHFKQHLKENRQNCKSTWEGRQINHSTLQGKTKMYEKYFQKGFFNVEQLKPLVESEGRKRKMSELEGYLSIYNNIYRK